MATLQQKSQDTPKQSKALPHLTKKSTDKPPPQNIEAEQAVLGAILLDNQALFTALEFMELGDFYRHSHQTIFEAMIALIDDRHTECDLITLTEELERRERLDEIGGPAYLAALVDQVPTAANIEYHAKVVHDKAILRQLLNKAVEIAITCYDEIKLAGEVLEEAEQQVFAIADNHIRRGFVAVGPIIDKSVDYLDTICHRDGTIVGIATGFHDLDAWTAGLQPADMIVLAGRPSMGKTTLGVQFCYYNSVTLQIPTGMFSLEMSQQQLGLRLLSVDAKIDLHHLRTGKLTEEEWQRIIYAQHRIRNAPLYIDDTPSIPILELRAKARRLKREKQIQLLLIDYLTLVRPTRTYESETREVTEISRSLKALAKELNIPVVVLSQLNRDCEKRADKRPQLSDLRSSGAIEQDADVVLFIYRPEVYGIEGCEGLAEIIIGKQRNGPIGMVQLAFLKEYTRFENLETRRSSQASERVF